MISSCLTEQVCVYYNTGNISISSKLLYSNNRGAHLKKLHRAEEGVKIVGVFRVKNHDFTPKNQIFSNFRRGRAPGAPPPLYPPLNNEDIFHSNGSVHFVQKIWHLVIHTLSDIKGHSVFYVMHLKYIDIMFVTSLT